MGRSRRFTAAQIERATRAARKAAPAECQGVAHG